MSKTIDLSEDKSWELCVICSKPVSDGHDHPKPIESLDSPRVILQMYADIDPDELGEDKFIGHHSLDKALKELESYITERERLAKVDELKNIDSLTHSFMSLGNDFVYEYRQSSVDKRIQELNTNG